MPTNILSLAQFAGTETSFSVTQNADWNDSVFFASPGAVAVSMTGSITSGSNVVTVVATTGIIPGMVIEPTPGIISGVFVGAVSSITQFTMVDANGQAVNATDTNVAAKLNFTPFPLDITGIEFKAELRALVGGNEVYLIAQTSDGTLVNGGASGLLTFAVPQETLAKVFPGDYVMDILAIADGKTINLHRSQGPATVTITAGVTNPSATG